MHYSTQTAAQSKETCAFWCLVDAAVKLEGSYHEFLEA